MATSLQNKTAKSVQELDVQKFVEKHRFTCPICGHRLEVRGANLNMVFNNQKMYEIGRTTSTNTVQREPIQKNLNVDWECSSCDVSLSLIMDFDENKINTLLPMTKQKYTKEDLFKELDMEI